MTALSSVVLSQFYYKVIIPSVTYNISVWGNGKPGFLDKLNKTHGKAAQVIFRLPEKLTPEECLAKVKLFPISYFYKRRLLCIMHNVF